MNETQHISQSAVDVIGSLAALLITAIYLRLSLRASEVGGIPRANLALGACVIAWTTAEIVSCLIDFLPSRGPVHNNVFLAAQSVEETFALLTMIPVLSFWKEEFKALRARRNIASLQFVIMVMAIAVLGMNVRFALQTGSDFLPLQRPTLFRAVFVCLALPVLVTGFLTLRHRAIAPVARFSLILILIGTLGLTLSLQLRNSLAISPRGSSFLNATIVWCPLVIITGVVFMFARFRFADRFIRQCARIVSAATLGIAVAVVISWMPFPQLTSAYATQPGPMLVLAGIVTSTLLIAFLWFDNFLNLLVDRLVFPAPDYDGLVIVFQKKLLHLDRGREVIAAACDFIRTTLRMEKITVIRLSRVDCEALSIPFINSASVVAVDAWPPGIHGLSGVEILAPFRIRDHQLDCLAVEPGAERRGLVTHEVGFIRTVVSQLSVRLQSLQHQRSLIESESREARLQQQVIAAELQALRAQINPHFLFNALNTLADLISTDAAGAETMTLRLARVFRHVLAHSSRPMVSVREEMEFLRTYLDIEEARFGDRLKVSFTIDPAANSLLIPSLLLQPIIENSLKHGLAPKPGPGHLSIVASVKDERLHIIIEDDGMGLTSAGSLQNKTAANHGLGLGNIRRRLETQYSRNARFTLESRQPAGVTARIVLPLSTPATAA